MIYRAYRVAMVIMATTSVFFGIAFLKAPIAPVMYSGHWATELGAPSFIVANAPTATALAAGASEVNVYVYGHELTNVVRTYCNIDWTREAVSCPGAYFYGVEVVE